MPQVSAPLLDEMKLTNKEYAALNAQAANYRTILRYLKAAGFDNFLRETNRAAIDLVQTPDDTTGGESAMFFLKSIADECVNMDQRIKDLSAALLETNISLTHEKRKNKAYIKKSFFRKIKEFIFVTED